MAIVHEIGAAAGLAGIVGLVALSALYLSQARDVKRLREWAGRVPERPEPGVTAAPGHAAVPPPGRPRTSALARGEPSYLSGPHPVTPAGGSGSPPVVPQPVRRSPGPERPATEPAALPAVSGQDESIPPRRSQAWYSRIGTPYVALLVGVVVLGGAAAYGVGQLTGDDGGGTSDRTPAHNDNAPPKKAKRAVAAVKPANVTVAVLNGTTVTGLAAAMRDEIVAAGFKKGTINVFSNQQLTESVVQYAPGRQAEAKLVGRKFGISRREPMTANSRALAGNATVVVIAGADKAP